MTNNPVISFPSDGATWRLDWFGDVRYRREIRTQEPFIQVTLSKVLLDSSDLWSYPDHFAEQPEQFSSFVPVGMLQQLRIGTIWQDGLMVSDPGYVQETFQINVNTNTTLIKAGLADDDGRFILPFESHPYHRKNTHSYCMSVSLGGHDRLIIPAVEMIRFYFGSSGSLLKRLFLVPFAERRFWSRESINEDGVADIELAGGVSGASASDIARIALDNRARHAAALISKSLMTRAGGHESSYPKMVFPFQGRTRLTVRGVWLNGMGSRTFLAFQIASCSHTFPFSKLHYTTPRKNWSKRQNDNGATAPSTMSVAGSSQRQHAMRLPLTNDPPDARKSPKTISVVSASRFPDLDYKSVMRVDPIKPVQIIVNNSGEYAAAAAVGEGEGNTGIQPIELVEAEEAPVLERHPLEKSAFAQFVDRVVRTLIKERKKVSYVALDKRQRFPQFSVMPEIVNEDGEIHPLSIIRQGNKNRSRYVCILSISNSPPFAPEARIILETEADKGSESQERAMRTFRMKDGESIGAAWVARNVKSFQS